MVGRNFASLSSLCPQQGHRTGKETVPHPLLPAGEKGMGQRRTPYATALPQAEKGVAAG
nr:hypothetical protein SHINE37_42440 [Rhizobiaceae bacterium]